MSDSNAVRDDDGRKAVVAYVAALSGELAGMARENGLDTSAYILDMARLEAEETARGFELAS